MNIQTMSIVVGDSSCNAKCPFCIARTTPELGYKLGYNDKINWRNFDIACKLADKSGATTAILTGKGEPTLRPAQISAYLDAMNKNDCFPIRELQTNGIELMKSRYDDRLKSWYDKGLTTICLSSVHYRQSMNAKIYGDGYPHIKELADKLHDMGFTTRLSVMMIKGFIDTKPEVKSLIAACKNCKVKQLTIRPITCPTQDIRDESQEVYDWIIKNAPSEVSWNEIKEHISAVGNSVLKLAHDTEVFDYAGQNVCLGTCITTNKSSEQMRQNIFEPDGTIGYDWKYSGAVLL